MHMGSVPGTRPCVRGHWGPPGHYNHMQKSILKNKVTVLRNKRSHRNEKPAHCKEE